MHDPGPERAMHPKGMWWGVYTAMLLICWYTEACVTVYVSNVRNCSGVCT